MSNTTEILSNKLQQQKEFIASYNKGSGFRHIWIQVPS